jgi:hypothetical protein
MTLMRWVKGYPKIFLTGLEETLSGEKGNGLRRKSPHIFKVKNDPLYLNI